MKNRILIYCGILASLLLAGCNNKYVDDKDISLVYSNLDTAQMYQKSEIGLSINLDSSINVYNEDDISVSALVITPDGQELVVPMFYYEEYARHLEGQMEILDKIGDGQFRLRYTPRIAGEHKIKVTIAQNGVVKKYPADGYLNFNVKPGTKDAFLKVSDDKTHLEYSNGAPYVGIGHNMCGWEWAGSDNMSGTYEYDKWFHSLVNQGGNMVQFDLSEGDQIEWTRLNNELEWSNCYNGLGFYNQKTCFKNDYKVSLADQLGLFYRFTLFHWEDFDTESDNFPDWGWLRNPYNSANSGNEYATDVSDFFVNEACKKAVKNFLRYVVARWGYSTNMMMYELFNEVDAPGMFWGRNKSYSTALPGITAWHKEMSAYLKELDVNTHMISTSCASAAYGNEFWQLKDIDITTIHNYTMYNDEGTINQYEIVKNTTEFVTSRISSTKKPIVFGEFALSPGGNTQREFDKKGVSFHNGLYSAIMAGSLGTTMHWTWGSYIDEYDLYNHYKGVNTLFDGADLRGFKNFNNLETGQQEGRIWYTGLKSDNRAYVWVKDSMYDYNQIRYGYIERQINAGTFEITNMIQGDYSLEFVDTYNGKILSTAEVTVGTNKKLVVSYPAFMKDFGIKIVLNSDYYQSVDMTSSATMNSSYTIQNKSKITVYGTGYSVSGISDSCRFVYLSTSNNFTYTARLDKANYGGNGANAGIMVRESLGGASKMVFVGYTNYGTYETVYRQNTGNTAVRQKYGETLNLGCYIRIVKQDSEVSTYISNDGINFNLAKTLTMDLTTSYIGVAVSNTNESGYAKGVFSNITFSR
ncbi:MAG: hypothetical protein MJ221_03985 [Bacilli bacterium]|nr:hypothetical protein [Bacilli bacterium]